MTHPMKRVSERERAHELRAAFVKAYDKRVVYPSGATAWDKNLSDRDIFMAGVRYGRKTR